jgi:hypothetical protein
MTRLLLLGGGLLLLSLTALWTRAGDERVTPVVFAPAPPADLTPLLRVRPTVGEEGQQATATVDGLRHPAVATWRWARLVVESADGSVPIDSVWQLPAAPVRRTWTLRGTGDTWVTLTLFYDSGREAGRIARQIAVH